MKRVCVVSRCSRLSRQGEATCWRHRLRIDGDVMLDDPLATAADDFDRWWPVARSRIEDLHRVADDAGARRPVKQAAMVEFEAIRMRAFAPAIRSELAGWQASHGAPGWWLPPDGWMADRLREAYPQLRTPESAALPPTNRHSLGGLARYASTYGRYLDYVVRDDIEKRSPTQRPFAPITEPREVNAEHVELLQAQERRNLAVYRRYVEVLNAYKREEVQPGLMELFDPARSGVDAVVPDGVVVYHQIRGVDDRGRTSAPLARWALRQHLALRPGQFVRYAHVRSATTKRWYFESLDPIPPRWLNDGYIEEDGLRLELAPRRGVYIAQAAGEAAHISTSHENELILPPGVWKVVGHRDVVQRNSRRDHWDTSTPERSHNILMVEVDPTEVPDGTQVTLLTTSDPGRTDQLAANRQRRETDWPPT